MRDWGTFEQSIILSEHIAVRDHIAQLHQFCKDQIAKLETIKHCTKEKLAQETFIFCWKEIWKGSLKKQVGIEKTEGGAPFHTSLPSHHLAIFLLPSHLFTPHQLLTTKIAEIEESQELHYCGNC